MSDSSHTSMLPETLEALQGSIAKWEAIVAGADIDKGGENCPLCQRFAYNGNACAGCPVRERTGLRLCSGTPYSEHFVWRPEISSYQPTKETAARMLAFLKDLLPAAQSDDLVSEENGNGRS